MLPGVEECERTPPLPSTGASARGQVPEPERVLPANQPYSVRGISKLHFRGIPHITAGPHSCTVPYEGVERWKTRRLIRGNGEGNRLLAISLFADLTNRVKLAIRGSFEVGIGRRAVAVGGRRLLPSACHMQP